MVTYQHYTISQSALCIPHYTFTPAITMPAVTCTGYFVSGAGGGPAMFLPERSYRPPWQGQTNSLLSFR